MCQISSLVAMSTGTDKLNSPLDWNLMWTENKCTSNFSGGKCYREKLSKAMGTGQLGGCTFVLLNRELRKAREQNTWLTGGEVFKLKGKANAKALRWSMLGVSEERQARENDGLRGLVCGARRQVCTSGATL